LKVLSLKSTERSSSGKGHARSLRRQGLIPAILYGQDAQSLKLSLKVYDLEKIIKKGNYGQLLIDLDIQGKIKKVTIKELQRHPASSEILHIDFYEVAMNREIKVSIPIVPIGISKGVELGGLLQIVKRKVEVFCFPDKIPSAINIDITNLKIGDSFHLNDLVLDKEIKLSEVNTNYTILTILSGKSDISEEDSKESEKTEEEKKVI
jgi:large subunit ribosomal protein L25